MQAETTTNKYNLLEEIRLPLVRNKIKVKRKMLLPFGQAYFNMNLLKVKGLCIFIYGPKNVRIYCLTVMKIGHTFRNIVTKQ